MCKSEDNRTIDKYRGMHCHSAPLVEPKQSLDDIYAAMMLEQKF
jgi:hypothetical protein